jgi:hypothetical protein
LGVWAVAIGAAVLWTMAPSGCRLSALEDDGFVPLFDGQTLDGWEGDQTLWKVVDREIVGDSPGIPHNQFLATRKSYGNFELKLEFRLAAGRGNSGVQFRSKRVPDSSEVAGYQADIGEQYWGYTIRAVGPRITLAINGVTTVDYTEADSGISRTGRIALQVHSGPPLRVAFRNIRIRELPPDAQ